MLVNYFTKLNRLIRQYPARRTFASQEIIVAIHIFNLKYRMFHSNRICISFKTVSIMKKVYLENKWIDTQIIQNVVDIQINRLVLILKLLDSFSLTFTRYGFLIEVFRNEVDKSKSIFHNF